MAVRDRAAYMRDYRARKRTEAPVLRQQMADLTERVARLGARVDQLEALFAPDGPPADRGLFAASEALKKSHQPAPTARR